MGQDRWILQGETERLDLTTPQPGNFIYEGFAVIEKIPVPFAEII